MIFKTLENYFLGDLPDIEDGTILINCQLIRENKNTPIFQGKKDLVFIDCHRENCKLPNDSQTWLGNAHDSNIVIEEEEQDVPAQDVEKVKNKVKGNKKSMSVVGNKFITKKIAGRSNITKQAKAYDPIPIERWNTIWTSPDLKDVVIKAMYKKFIEKAHLALEVA